MDQFKRNKKSSRRKSKPWSEDCFERWPREGGTESQFFRCQEQYERGLAMASLCTAKSCNNFVNNFQTESFLPVSSAGDLSEFPNTPQSCSYGGFSQLPSCPFPNQITEDRTNLPSFRFMKIRKKVRICSADPRLFLSFQQLETLSDEILERVLTPEGGDVKPRFYGMEIRNECLIITIGDDTTLYWLKKITNELSYGGVMKLKLIVEADDDKMFTAVGHFPNSQNDPNERILRFVQNQNEGLNTHRWTIINRILKNNIVQLTLFIDYTTAEILKVKGDRISYKFGVAELFLKSDEKFEEESNFPTESTQFLNPFAFSEGKSNVTPICSEMSSIPIAISNYLEEYKTRINDLVEKSKNSFIRGLSSRYRNRFVETRNRKLSRKRKKKVKVSTTLTEKNPPSSV